MEGDKSHTAHTLDRHPRHVAILEIERTAHCRDKWRLRESEERQAFHCYHGCQGDHYV